MDEDAWTGFPLGDGTQNEFTRYRPVLIQPQGRTKRKIIEDYIDKKVSRLPPRLIDLKNRRLIHKADLAREMKNFLIDFTVGNEVHQSKILIEQINSRLSYAIFSHRWSQYEPDLKNSEDNFSRWWSELALLEDVPQNVGIRKLINFCAKAQKHGLDLAWSDTCCIDQTNSAELQEAIGSMFQWYRGAKLCIIHMADTKTPEDAKAGKGEWHDGWFKRGWTLQELLAPKALKFYTEGWDELVKGSNNDKENEDLLRKLEDATGIESESIKNFIPGVRGWKDKVKWVSQRQTTRKEDIACILFGMFGLDMNGRYVESV